jgi:dTDP-L-rhamnose 4-epimerase
VRNPDAVREALKGVDHVVHLAAEVGVGQSMYEIARYVGANDLGTAALLEAITKEPIRRLVVASSMSVYGEGRYTTEDGIEPPFVRRGAGQGASWDPVMPDGRKLVPIATHEAKQPDLASIYALTKYVQDQSCLIIGSSYPIECVALRLFNVFGPGQALSNPYTGVVANFGARLANGQRPIVFEDGRQRRDFVHVRDVARAFRLAMETPAAAGHVINIGSGKAYKIGGIAEMLAGAMGVPELRPMLLGQARAGDIRHCFADITKARALLGFEPRFFLEESLAEIAGWIGASCAADRGEDARRQLDAFGLIA